MMGPTRLCLLDDGARFSASGKTFSFGRLAIAGPIAEKEASSGEGLGTSPQFKYGAPRQGGRPSPSLDTSRLDKGARGFLRQKGYDIPRPTSSTTRSDAMCKRGRASRGTVWVKGASRPIQKKTLLPIGPGASTSTDGWFASHGDCPAHEDERGLFYFFLHRRPAKSSEMYNL